MLLMLLPFTGGNISKEKRVFPLLLRMWSITFTKKIEVQIYQNYQQLSPNNVEGKGFTACFLLTFAAAWKIYGIFALLHT
jgi:hypothetical protein